MSQDLIGGNQMATEKGYGEEWAKRVYDENTAVDHFLALKSNYENQRQPWESKWKQALAAYHLTDDLEQVYTGKANVKVPIMKWKVNGVVARINRILFNIDPIGRLDDKKLKPVDNTIVDLWNKYIFESQLEAIEFKQAFKQFNKSKTIEGTAVAEITQEYEEKKFTFFEDEEPEKVVVKDNTYFRNLLLTEFYSDVNFQDINKSQACIKTSSVSMEFLYENRTRTIQEEVEDEYGNIEIVNKEVGFYKNLNLLASDGGGSNITEEQETYIEFLGLNKGATKSFKDSLKKTKKTGFVQIDECYGLYDLGNGLEEVKATIANGRICIELIPTPFKHKRYVRPFIVGRSEPIANCLYGTSFVISGRQLLMELNACRAQALDAKTRAISHMYTVDETKNVRWDGQWRPGGIVYSQGGNAIQPLINPNLSNVSINDSEFIMRDLDQLSSLSPVQEGTTDSRLIPKTARATLSIISQNDMPLNDLIDNSIEGELKPFLEMLYERNLVYKDVSDLLEVWDVKNLEKAGLGEDTHMKEFMFDFDIKILGNLELSNEVAHQQGWNQFINWAMKVPPVAKHLDWQAVAQKQLAAFGVKDVAEGIWIDDQVMMEVDQEQAQAEQQQVQQVEQQRQNLRQEGRQDAEFGTALRTEAKIVEMQSEAMIERATGQKVQ